MTAPTAVRALILSWMVAALIGCSDESAGPSHQQQPPPPDPTGAIEGVVMATDATTPIEGAVVVVTPGELQLATGPDGDFLFDELPVGSYQIDAAAAGYLAASLSGVDVVEGETAHVELVLAEQLSFPSTCASCHLRQEMLLASLEEDPLPEEGGETESTGEG